jgi:hypothetical protein
MAQDSLAGKSFRKRRGIEEGQIEPDAWIIGPDDPILVTGATGFIGMRLVENFLEQANGLVERMSGTIKAQTVYRWNFDSVGMLDVALLWVRTLFQ